MATDPATARRPRPRTAIAVVPELGTSSDAELIAQVLDGPEPAAEVMRCAERLSTMPFWERRSLGVPGLVEEHGVRPDRAARLVALWELAERWYPDQRPAVLSVRDALLLLEPLRRDRVERVMAVLLDSRRRHVATETIAVGSLNASRLSARDVLVPALRADAAALIVAHGHPSGDPHPSGADRRVTETLRAGAALVGLALVDHLIITRRGHYSFRECERWEDAA